MCVCVCVCVCVTIFVRDLSDTFSYFQLFQPWLSVNMLKASHMLFTDNTFLGKQKVVFAEKKSPLITYEQLVYRVRGSN